MVSSTRIMPGETGRGKKDGLILALSSGKNRTGSRTWEIRPRDYISICFLRASNCWGRERWGKVKKGEERRRSRKGSEQLGAEAMELDKRINEGRKRGQAV